MSRRVEKHWRLIGWGDITDGMKVSLRDANAKGGFDEDDDESDDE